MRLNYQRAIDLCDISIEQSNQAIDIQPDYIYAYNGKIEALMYKGDLNILLGNVDDALNLYKEGLQNTDQILIRLPKADYALKKKMKIESKIFDLSEKEVTK